jgi:hypothetical protein
MQLRIQPVEGSNLHLEVYIDDAFREIVRNSVAEASHLFVRYGTAIAPYEHLFDIAGPVASIWCLNADGTIAPCAIFNEQRFFKVIDQMPSRILVPGFAIAPAPETVAAKMEAFIEAEYATIRYFQAKDAVAMAIESATLSGLITESKILRYKKSYIEGDLGTLSLELPTGEQFEVRILDPRYNLGA